MSATERTGTAPGAHGAPPMPRAVHGDGRVATNVDGIWYEGNPPIVGSRSNALWLASVVFDGARSLGGHAPDLDRHCRRTIESAHAMGMSSPLTAREIESLAREGIQRFAANTDLYICPMIYADEGFVIADPQTTRFVLTVFESPLPEPTGFSACRSSFRRPARDMAPTDAKASCLYPNVARSVREANERGFDTGVVLDPAGNVAEFSYANLFFGHAGVVHTPAINGTFLNGITRQRVIALLRDDGIPVVERAIDLADVLAADELFCTSNYYKVAPCTRIEERPLPPGPLYTRARELYMAFAGKAV